MGSAIAQYERLVSEYEGNASVVAGQMFGKPCMKVNGKAFVAQHKETVVFKLSGPSHEKAMLQTGAVLWDPSGKGRPMKEWVALPMSSSKQFKLLAATAYEYVANAA
jgi:hypothetical protein